MTNTTVLRSLFIIFGIVLLFAAPCAAQDTSTIKVDDFIRTEMQKQGIPGVSVAIVKNGQIVFAKGYGLANVEHQVAVKPETIFQSGSVGKQFTATAVMMLVEEGKINLDEKINKYLGDVPDAWKNITVRHLLTHTAGLNDNPKEFDFRSDYTEDELLKRAQAIPVAFQPGEKWQYSNMGYVMLGIVIGKVTGKFYGDFLQERIFKPLGMTTARINSEADIVPNRAAGYRLAGGELKNQEWVSPTFNSTADGSLYLTTLDLAKWDAALYGEKLLKKTSLEQMWTPVKLNDGKTHPYGFGWYFGEANGHRIIEHGGEWQGFTSSIVRYVDDQLTVVVLDNLAGVNATKMAASIAAIYNPELTAPPIKPTEDKEQQITAQVKELLKAFATGTADPNLFTKEMQNALFPDKAKQFGEMLKSLGAPSKIQLIDRKQEGELREKYLYRLIFQKSAFLFTVSFNKESKIAGMFIKPE